MQRGRSKVWLWRFWRLHCKLLTFLSGKTETSHLPARCVPLQGSRGFLSAGRKDTFSCCLWYSQLKLMPNVKYLNYLASLFFHPSADLNYEPERHHSNGAGFQGFSDIEQLYYFFNEKNAPATRCTPALYILYTQLSRCHQWSRLSAADCALLCRNKKSLFDQHKVQCRGQLVQVHNCRFTVGSRCMWTMSLKKQNKAINQAQTLCIKCFTKIWHLKLGINSHWKPPVSVTQKYLDYWLKGANRPRAQMKQIKGLEQIQSWTAVW